VYVVTGATGNTGSRIADRLLEEGVDVKVISRDRSKLEPFVEKGAVPAEGNLRNQDFVNRVFEGADAVYGMIPSDYSAEDFRAYQNDISTSIVRAVQKNEVPHVVALSSVGAHLDSGTGVVLGLHDMEQHFRKLQETNVLCLRPCFFMENFYTQMPVIREQNTIAMAVEEDLSNPMIHTRDIANYAAKRLLNQDFTDFSHQYLLGERSRTFGEATEILGSAIGRPDLQYVQVDYPDAREAMMEQGMSEDVARRYNDLFRRMNDGSINEDAERTPESTTPTSFEQFADEFAEAFSAGSA